MDRGNQQIDDNAVDSGSDSTDSDPTFSDEDDEDEDDDEVEDEGSIYSSEDDTGCQLRRDFIKPARRSRSTAASYVYGRR